MIVFVCLRSVLNQVSGGEDRLVCRCRDVWNKDGSGKKTYKFYKCLKKKKKKKRGFRTDRDVIQITNMRLDDWQGRHFFFNAAALSVTPPPAGAPLVSLSLSLSLSPSLPPSSLPLFLSTAVCLIPAQALPCEDTFHAAAEADTFRSGNKYPQTARLCLYRNTTRSRTHVKRAHAWLGLIHHG